MNIKGKNSNGADANLQLSFDVGHSSIGWAVLEKTGAQASDIDLLGWRYFQVLYRDDTG